MSRRQALLRQAIDLFAVRGYEATPTLEIATRAGVAEGTLFHHFGTKEGVLREILVDVLDRYFDRAIQRVEGVATGWEGLEALLSTHFAFVAENRSEMSVLIRDFPYHLLAPETAGSEELLPRFRRLLDLFVSFLERGILDGSVREVPVDETAQLLRGLLFGASRVALLGPMKAPDLLDTTREFCRRSLAATPIEPTEEGS